MSVERMLMEAKSGDGISDALAKKLLNVPLNELCRAANEVRENRCGTAFDLCSIINAKSGLCSENCSFCAQSSSHNAHVRQYPLLTGEELFEAALKAKKSGILRFSIVTSGGALSSKEIDSVCKAVEKIRSEADISVCLSLGLLSEAQFRLLHSAGAERIHNNLESSKGYFPKICTTHSWEEKCEAIKAAQSAGLTVCSGGIIGLGEEPEDRIAMVSAIRALGVKSIPVNILNPIPGTPLENMKPLPYEELLRTIAIFRLMLPDSAIRLAGGRALLPEHGEACLLSGANAAITGNMLTTTGPSAQSDIMRLKNLGYEVKDID